MIYKTTRRADQDITDLYLQGYEVFGPDQADGYIDGLLALFDLLAQNPRIARERSEFDPSVRLHPYRAHLVVYIERDYGALIVRVLHGRQDWERHLQ